MLDRLRSPRDASMGGMDADAAGATADRLAGGTPIPKPVARGAAAIPTGKAAPVGEAAPEALTQNLGGTAGGGHLLVLNLKRYATMDDAAFQETVARVIGEVAQTHDIAVRPSTYHAEHLDGNADYARTLAGRPDALRSARDAISAAQPEYIRYATGVRADPPAAERELADRIGSLDRLLNPVENPPQLGRTKGGSHLLEAAKQVYLRVGSWPHRRYDISKILLRQW